MRRAIIAAGALTVGSLGLTAKGQTLYEDNFYTTHNDTPGGPIYRPPTNGSGAGTLGDTQWVSWANGRNYNQTGFVNITGEEALPYWGFGSPSDPGFPNPVHSPMVAGGQPGAIFWSPLVDNMVMYTQNANLVAAGINTSSVRNISFYAQSDPVPQVDNASMFQTNGWNLHAVVEVGGSWYASVNEQQVAEENAKNMWGYFTISTAATQWVPMTLNDNSNANFYSGPIYTQAGTTPISLPAGAIQGVGVGTGVGAYYFAPGGSTTDTPPHSPNLEITDFQVSHTPAPVVWGNGYAVANSLTPADGTTWDVNNNLNWGTGTFPEVYASPYVDGDGTANNLGGAVVFNDSNNGQYNVTVNTTVHPGSVAFSNSAGNYTLSGAGHIGGTASLTKSGTSTVTLSTVNTYSGGTSVTAGTLVAGVNGAIPDGTVTISGGTLRLGQSTGLAQFTSLSITGAGSLDINNNHVIITYTPGNDPIASIVAFIQSGANATGGNPTWTGTGITSSAAAANLGSYGIGYADAADPGNPAGLASGQIEIAYTLLGDANLDEKVNGADFAILATNFNKAVSGVGGWDQGDFNYDGKINGADFASLALNFNKGASQAADAQALDAFAAANGLSVSSVPEPATIGLILSASCGLLFRRRRGG